MIEEFKNRPKPITAAEWVLYFIRAAWSHPNDINRYAEKKKNLGFQAQLLMEHGSTIQGTLKEVARGNPANRRYRQAKNKEMNFRKDVMILEYHYLKLEEAYKYQGGNIIWHYFKFGCGILGYVFCFSEQDTFVLIIA